MIIFLPVQCRMARAALGLGVRELAAAAKVSVDTVARFERGDDLKERTVEALQRALEAAGVEFTNGDGPGVRLTRALAASSSKPSAPAKIARTKATNAPGELEGALVRYEQSARGRRARDICIFPKTKPIFKYRRKW
jgi:transcriptional regulator with XRE-family HTH domain